MSNGEELVTDDLAYVLPMAAFLAVTWVGTEWPSTFPAGYIVKTIAAGVLLFSLRKQYTKISWRFWYVGLLMGIVGVVQWVGMEKLLLHHLPHYWRPSGVSFEPDEINNQYFRYLFLVFRLAGPVLVVPFMEELFWRDFLWRTVIDLDDFKRQPVGKWNWKALLIVTILFATVHVQWMTAIVWGLMIGVLMIRTKSLGACIVMHATTNLLLGGWILWKHDWGFW